MATPTNKPYTTQYSSIARTPQKGSAEYGAVEKDAQQEYLDRLKAIDMRIKQTQALREADMAAIRRNTGMAQRDINDQMFREYLANRERMGGRGVANTGLMADAQIRLNANKQDRLAELYTNTQDKLGEVNRIYAPQQTELLGERQNTRQSKIFQEMFDKMMERRSREAGMIAPLMQNEFTDEQRRFGETFNRNERINRQLFDTREAEKTRAAELAALNRRLAAEAEQNRLNRKNALDLAAASRSSGGGGGGGGAPATDDKKAAADRATNMDYYAGQAEYFDNVVENITKRLETPRVDADGNQIPIPQQERIALETSYRVAAKRAKVARDLIRAYGLGNAKAINDLTWVFNNAEKGIK